ncbi:DUF4214 domain-containing protein [Mesorhizobium xinjiangense]|uniref:DUF4214 domain-containing protein n=1 Tax=Mesorhizobium xinjiangense TaxID=2678685 RepID=UPI0012EDEAA4|nr:DUF4214 domain-containing protein [Mesorhizobium xinjiangense]
MIKRLVLALACLAGAVGLARAEIAWGVNGHPFTAYPGIDFERQLDYVRDLGMTSYRVNISDAGQAEALASLVEAGKARRVAILPVITPGNVDLDKDDPDALYRKAYDLAHSLASRFKDDIRVWELGNEMENHAIIQPCETRDDGSQYPCEWGPAGGTEASHYYGPRWVKVSAVLKGLSDGVEAADPEIRKAMGTAGWGHVGAFERMQADGIDWDISVWHIYGEDPEWAFKTIAGYGRPIWVTEFNNPLGSQRSARQQEVGLKGIMTRLRRLQSEYDVEAAHIYELLDEPYWAPGPEAQMGLVEMTAKPDGGWRLGEPKPAYLAVRELIRGGRPLPDPAAERLCDLDARDDGASMHALRARYVHCLVLGRADEENGLAELAAAFESGHAEAGGAIVELMRSAEFAERYAPFGLTHRAYVSFLYRLLLDRNVDAYGFDTYGRELDAGNMTRFGVALSIVRSSEFESRHPVLFQKTAAAQTADAVEAE